MFCPGSPTPPQAPDPELPAVQLPVPAREGGASLLPGWGVGSSGVGTLLSVSSREVSYGGLDSRRNLGIQK